MTIAIQCAKCAKQYKVDDKLAGKKVKCRDCGAAIVVGRGGSAAAGAARPVAAGRGESLDDMEREPDIFGLMEEEPANDLESVAATASQRPAAQPMRVCPACKSSVAKGSVICLSCGYNFRTGRGGKMEIPLVNEGAETTVVKKRTHRQRGSELLHSIDGYLAMAVFLLVAAGVATWMMHVLKTAPAFSVGLVLPTVVVLGLIVGVVAPLVTTGIKVAAHFLNFPARHDTYTRVLMVFMLPFGIALLCGGSVGQNPALADTISGSWLAACGMFLFLFRGEILELASSSGAALAAMLIAWGAVSFVMMLLTLATGPLYLDAMPPAGPWTALASGHSPAVPATVPANGMGHVAVGPAAPLPPATVAPTIPAPGELFSGSKGRPAGQPSGSPEAVSPGTAVPRTPGHGVGGGASGTSIASGGPVAPAPAVVVVPQNPSPNQLGSLNRGPVTPGTPGTRAPVVPDTGTKTVLHSKFLTDIQVDPAALQGVRDICTTLTPSTWMLAIKNVDGGTVSVQRWSTDPLAKKGELTYQELPRQPNSYALSPSGTYLVVLSRFPKWQLEIATFDNKPARRIGLTDKLPPAEMAAVPGLMGFIDASHFLVRWDLNGRTVVQVYNCPGGEGFKKIMTENFGSSVNDWAVSPDGRSLAVLNTMPGAGREMFIYDTMGNVAPRHFNPVAMDFNCKGIAFSPDNRTIALYSAAKEATSVLGFSVLKGESIYTAILPQSDETFRRSRHVTDEPQDLDPHGLYWLKDSQEWLVDGTTIYDPASGRKVGMLGVPGNNDQRVVGSDMVVLMERGVGLSHDPRQLVVAKLNEEGIRDGVENLRK